MLTIAGLGLGLVLLVGGGWALVAGASQVAKRLGVSPMIVGLTVVAFGTSMPELIVSMIGAARGATELVFGNIVGSNVANFALVLGAAALIRPIDIQGQLVQRELPLLLLATAVLTVLALDTVIDGTVAEIGRSDAIILILVFCIFIYISVLDIVRSKRTEPLLVTIGASKLVRKEAGSIADILLTVAGVGMLYFGGEMTIRNGIALAERVQLSQAIIGLFVIAVGTSLPELVTSVIAAAKNESDLALGNIVGSNIFNTLLVLSASAMLTPVRIPQGGVGDLLVSLLCVVVLVPVFLFGKARLGRVVGTGFLLFFFAWAAYRMSA